MKAITFTASLFLLFIHFTTAHSGCILPAFNGKGERCSLVSPNAKNTKDNCCPGFECSQNSHTCTRKAKSLNTPEHAVTAHSLLAQTADISRTLTSTLDQAAQALTVSHVQLNYISNLIQVDNHTNKEIPTSTKDTQRGKSSKSFEEQYEDAERDIRDRAKAFWDHMNETLNHNYEELSDFAQRSKITFYHQQYPASSDGNDADSRVLNKGSTHSHGTVDEKSEKDTKSEKEDDNNKKEEQVEGKFDFTKFIPDGVPVNKTQLKEYTSMNKNNNTKKTPSSDKNSPNNDDKGLTTFDWSQFVPQGITIPKNNDSKSSSNDKVSHVSTGFDWSVYIPSGTQTSEKRPKDIPVNPSQNNEKIEDDTDDDHEDDSVNDGEHNGNTGVFDWSRFVPNGTSTGTGKRLLKGSSKEKEKEEAELKKKYKEYGQEMKNKGKESQVSGSQSGSGFDYSKYIPEQYMSGSGSGTGKGGDKVNRALLSEYLEENSRILNTLDMLVRTTKNLKQQKEEGDDDMYDYIYGFHNNTKTVAYNTALLADDISALADILADKVRAAASELKQAANDLNDNSEKYIKKVQEDRKLIARVQVQLPTRNEKQKVEEDTYAGKIWAVVVLLGVLVIVTVVSYQRNSRHRYTSLS